MKAAVVILFFAVSALGQQKARFGQFVETLPPACGAAQQSFKVTLVDTQHTLAPPEEGRALVYFIHDAGTPETLGYPTSKLGVDGKWIGANHGNSWFSVSVAPGEHHVCAALQSSFVDQRFELAHFTAEPGKVYFYRTRLVMSRTIELMELEPIDSDQGAYLITLFPQSIAKPKK